MIKIAIVEDNEEDADLLKRYLQKYGGENGEEFECVRHKNAITFLTNYKANYDIVFMDIDLPHMNGMEASAKIRELDERVILVFVTNLAHMAIRGYEVDAHDFIVKPVSYYDFVMKMKRVCKILKGRTQSEFSFNSGKGIVRLSVSNIYYVETIGHQLIFHTVSGDYKSYGFTLNKLESYPAFSDFVRCNSCYLINLSYVQKVEGYTVYVNGETLSVSHPRRAELIKTLNEYLRTHF